MYDFDGKPDNEFELESPYRPTLGDPVLLVPRFHEGPNTVAKHFSSADPHRGSSAWSKAGRTISTFT